MKNLKRTSAQCLYCWSSYIDLLVGMHTCMTDPGTHKGELMRYNTGRHAHTLLCNNAPHTLCRNPINSGSPMRSVTSETIDNQLLQMYCWNKYSLSNKLPICLMLFGGSIYKFPLRLVSFWYFWSGWWA